ncbi:MAG TPA: Gfo/Idh/MocA family oxidoreductase [Acidobacteriota bacterium]|nr:Gfo/Idh/MocA family oxidoreductase [Acidobacteriota bacterium]HNT17616.1 Gfo/Idh/MocA family oxidoreductase [Acidobacteriota bacterium]
MKAVVFGLGPMGMRHISALKELGYEISGLCDKSEEAVNKAGEELKLAPGLFFTDAGEMLEKTTPDLAVVSTNSDSHEHLTLLSAGKGVKYILCEKPMASSVGACQRMMEECASKGVRLAVNHPQRYMKRFRLLSQAVESEEFGGAENIVFISANAGLAMMGSHFLEMSRIILKESASSVSALLKPSTCRNPRGEKFDDPCGTVVAETASGKRTVIVLGDRSGLGIRMAITCRHGMIEGDLISGSFTFNSRKPESRDLPPTRYGCPSDTRTEVLESESVVESAKTMISGLVRGDREIERSAGDAMTIIKTLAAAYDSSEDNGKRKEVSDPGERSPRTFPWP